MTRFLLSLTAAIAAFASFAVAQPAPEAVGTFRDWIVYKMDVEGDTICYAVTEPEEKEPSSVNHGNVFFMVSTWKSGVAKAQPSFMSGYPLRERPEPLVRIGADKWDMFSSGVEGFVDDDRQEQRLVAAMRRGSEMRLSAMSERGTATEYTFSLYGISNALDRAEKACR
ncbi:MAG: hypothetical protein AAF986_02475 [Pseudomonadota bacterium]